MNACGKQKQHPTTYYLIYCSNPFQRHAMPCRQRLNEWWWHYIDLYANMDNKEKKRKKAKKNANVKRRAERRCGRWIHMYILFWHDIDEANTTIMDLSKFYFQCEELALYFFRALAHGLQRWESRFILKWKQIRSRWWLLFVDKHANESSFIRPMVLRSTGVFVLFHPIFKRQLCINEKEKRPNFLQQLNKTSIKLKSWRQVCSWAHIQ